MDATIFSGRKGPPTSEVNTLPLALVEVSLTYDLELFMSGSAYSGDMVVNNGVNIINNVNDVVDIINVLFFL